MGRSRTSVHSLVWRQIRVSTVVISLLLLIVIRVGESAFYSSGGVQGMASFVVLLKNPAISALYGRASSLDSAGAFVSWKMGMYMALAAALWAALIATRVTRGAEDDESWDLLALGRRGRGRALVTAVAVLTEGAVLLGVVTFLGLLLDTSGWTSCLLFAFAITGVAWSGIALGLLCSQVIAPRRSASQVALSAVGLMFLVRMLADSSNSLGWLRWTTAFGWLENLGSFQHHAPWWCLIILVVPGVGVGLTWKIQRHRDVGWARWTRSDRARARTRLLKSAGRFSWRERRSTLVAWSIGLAAVGLVIGYLTNALVAFGRTDPAYVRLLDRLGLGVIITAKGFVGEVCFMMTLALSFLVITSLVMLANDDLQGRLDLPFSYGASRSRWMVSAVVATAVGTLLVSLVCGLFIWLGVVASGTSMNLLVPIEGMANAVSTTPLLIGITILIVTLSARFAYLVVAALLALTYLVALLGPVLHWPHWLLSGSPFFYLRLVPAAPANWGAMVLCTLIGLAAGAGALWRFHRADVGR